MGYQKEYAIPNWKQSLTKLNATEESQFHYWAKMNNVPITDDYDMRGFWKGLQTGDKQAVNSVNPNDHMMHYPDKWKTPLHESFSGESMYAKKDGPHWNPHDQLVDEGGKVLFDEPRVIAKRKASQPMAKMMQGPTSGLPTIIPYESSLGGMSDPMGTGVSSDQPSTKNKDILQQGGIIGGVLKALGVTQPDNMTEEQLKAKAKDRKAVGESAKSFASDPEAAAEGFMGPQSGGSNQFDLGNIVQFLAKSL